MSNLHERAELKKVYKSRRWALKIDKMPDKKVSDTLKRLREQKKA